MRVVLVLPPPHAESLHQIAPEYPREVTVIAVLEHLRIKTQTIVVLKKQKQSKKRKTADLSWFRFFTQTVFIIQ